LELSLFSELVKDAESWLTVFLYAQQGKPQHDDVYYEYKNAAGEIITPKTQDQVVADSVKNDVGFAQAYRQTDHSGTLFGQDYLATNKNFKVHLNLLIWQQYALQYS
jgi:hypothetical protein